MYANIANAIKDIAFHRYEISERGKNVDLTFDCPISLGRFLAVTMPDIVRGRSSCMGSKRIVKRDPKRAKSSDAAWYWRSCVQNSA